MYSIKIITYLVATTISGLDIIVMSMIVLLLIYIILYFQILKNKGKGIEGNHPAIPNRVYYLSDFIIDDQRNIGKINRPSDVVISPSNYNPTFQKIGNEYELSDEAELSIGHVIEHK